MILVALSALLVCELSLLRCQLLDDHDTNHIPYIRDDVVSRLYNVHILLSAETLARGVNDDFLCGHVCAAFGLPYGKEVYR